MIFFIYSNILYNVYLVDSYADQMIQNIICKGRGAGYGATSGTIVFTVEDAKNIIDKNENVILCLDAEEYECREALKVSTIAFLFIDMYISIK
jgi:phosphoenolpyruvate synthase/pyruvate phosphate dikinase